MEDQRHTRVSTALEAASGNEGKLVPLPATQRVASAKGPLMEIAFRRSVAEGDSPARQAAGFAGGLALAAVLGVLLFIALAD